MSHTRVWLTLFVLSLFASTAHAQHADILVSVVGDRLAVDDSLYLSDFRGGLMGGGDILELSNPGYATQGANVLPAGALLGFETVGPLLHSDGTEWRPSDSDVYFELVRPSVDDHSVVVTGQSSSQIGFPLAQADDRGTLHEHIRFRLGRQEAGPPLDGVYGVQKVLTAPDLADSEPFMLIFNNGVATPEFINAVVAARQLIADSPFDCTEDGLLTTDDLVCVSEIDQRDRVLRSIGSVAGDLDGNGRVEFADFLILTQNFGTEAASYAAGNIDLTEGVGFPDFLILSQNFGYVGDAQVAIVPEPTSTQTLVGVLFFSAMFRRLTGKSRSRRRIGNVCLPRQRRASGRRLTFFAPLIYWLCDGPDLNLVAD